MALDINSTSTSFYDHVRMALTINTMHEESLKNCKWYQVSENKVLTNPGGAQVLGKELMMKARNDT